MARKRKRDWPQRNFKFAVKECTLPDSFWQQAKKMQALWNSLCEHHAAVRESINDDTPESDRKAKWAAFNELALQLVSESGLNWECGPDVFDRFTKACIAAARDGSRGWPRPSGLKVSIPHRYTGGGVEVSRLTSRTAKRFRLDTSRLCKPGRNNVSGEFGLDDGSIAFTIHQHRPLPTEAIVKSVRWCGRRSVAFGWGWHITITVEEPPAAERQKTGKSVAIDVGWRKRDNALRFGYLVDSDGLSKELLLSLDFSTRDSRRQRRLHPEFEQIPENHAELRDLQERRDRSLDACKLRLKEVLSPLPAGFEKMRGRGLSKLLMESESEQVKAIVQEWMDSDRPLFRTQSRASDRFANSRQSQYETLAANIARAYDVVYVEAVDIKGMAEDDDKGHALNAADRYRQIAAPGEFLACLKNACRKYQSEFIQRDAKCSTIRCHICGGNAVAGAEIELTCENGHRWDQDENAARNLLSQTWPVAVQKPKLRRNRKERDGKQPENTAVSG